MASNPENETERMAVTRVFDAPRALVWKAWTDPDYVVQWWGPKGFTAPVCRIDLRVGGKFLCCMRAPDGKEFWNSGEYHEIVPHEKIVSSMYFSLTRRATRLRPRSTASSTRLSRMRTTTVTFEDFGDGGRRS